MKNEDQTYIVVFDPSTEGGYNVSFPQLPGCVTFGHTLIEAQKMAKEALELWLEESGSAPKRLAIVDKISIKHPSPRRPVPA